MSQVRVAVLAAVGAAIGSSRYFGGLLLGGTISAAWLWRDLIVWKIFAPRYMLGAVEPLCVVVAMLVGLWLGICRITTCITHMFALPARSASSSCGTAEGQG